MSRIYRLFGLLAVACSLLVALIYSVRPVYAAGGTIRGTVTDVGGAPAAGVSVSVYKRIIIPQIPADYWSAVGGGTTSDSSGKYTVTLSEDGEYRLDFQDSIFPARYLREFYNNAQDVNQGTSIVISTGQSVTGIDIQLAKYSSLHGRVTNSTGQPLSQIQTILYQNVFGSWMQVSSGLLSDDSGNYTHTQILSGTYRLGFLGSTRYKPKFYLGASTFESATNISVDNGQSVSNIDLELLEKGKITGKVVDVFGKPISGMLVETFAPANGAYTDYGNAITDASGVYTTTGLEPGPHTVVFQCRKDDYGPPICVSEFYDNSFSQELATPVLVTESVATTNINAELFPLSNLTGTISDAQGKPIKGISVLARPRTQGGVERSSTSDDFGTYRIEGLVPGTYTVSFNDFSRTYINEFYNNQVSEFDATPLYVGISTTVTSINAQLTSYGKITGTVTDNANQPISGVDVTLWSNGGVYNHTTSDELGQYSLNGVSSGVYRVGFGLNSSSNSHVPEAYNNALSYEMGTDITVITSQVVSNINAQLDKWGQIVGLISDEADTPIPNVQVTAFISNSDPFGSSYYWGILMTAYTDAQGVYTLPVRTRTAIRLCFGGLSSQMTHANECHNDQSDIEKAENIIVSPETTMTINAKLKQAGSISGRVVDASNNLAPGIRIEAEQKTISGTWQFLRAGSTEFSGNYTLIALPIGVYRLRFIDASISPQYRSVYHDNTPYPELATQVIVSASTSTEVNATLELSSTANFPPLARTDTISVARGGTVTSLLTGQSSVLTNDEDTESNPLTATLVSTPEFGQLTFNGDGTFAYTHNGDTEFKDSFTYRAVDGVQQSNLATVTIKVSPIVRFEFSKTVAIEGITPRCTAVNEMKVPVGTTIVYCYKVRNTGDIALTNHTLMDDVLGTLLNNASVNLAADASYTVDFTQTLTVSTTNIATWTATSLVTTQSANSPTEQTDAFDVFQANAVNRAIIFISAPSDDQDGDTIPDNLEGAADPDKDNIPNFLDTDSDNDSILDKDEPKVTTLPVYLPLIRR